MPALTATDGLIYQRHNPLRIYLHIEGSRKSNQQLTRSWFEAKICRPAAIFQRFKGVGLLALRMRIYYRNLMFNDIKQHYKVISTIWTNSSKEFLKKLLDPGFLTILD